MKYILSYISIFVACFMGIQHLSHNTAYAACGGTLVQCTKSTSSSDFRNGQIFTYTINLQSTGTPVLDYMHERFPPGMRIRTISETLGSSFDVTSDASCSLTANQLYVCESVVGFSQYINDFLVHDDNGIQVIDFNINAQFVSMPRTITLEVEMIDQLHCQNDSLQNSLTWDGGEIELESISHTYGTYVASNSITADPSWSNPIIIYRIPTDNPPYHNTVRLHATAQTNDPIQTYDLDNYTTWSTDPSIGGNNFVVDGTSAYRVYQAPTSALDFTSSQSIDVVLNSCNDVGEHETRFSVIVGVAPYAEYSLSPSTVELNHAESTIPFAVTSPDLQNIYGGDEPNHVTWYWAPNDADSDELSEEWQDWKTGINNSTGEISIPTSSQVAFKAPRTFQVWTTTTAQPIDPLTGNLEPGKRSQNNTQVVIPESPYTCHVQTQDSVTDLPTEASIALKVVALYDNGEEKDISTSSTTWENPLTGTIDDSNTLQPLYTGPDTPTAVTISASNTACNNVVPLQLNIFSANLLSIDIEPSSSDPINTQPYEQVTINAYGNYDNGNSYPIIVDWQLISGAQYLATVFTPHNGSHIDLLMNDLPGQIQIEIQKDSFSDQKSIEVIPFNDCFIHLAQQLQQGQSTTITLQHGNTATASNLQNRSDQQAIWNSPDNNAVFEDSFQAITQLTAPFEENVIINAEHTACNPSAQLNAPLVASNIQGFDAVTDSLFVPIGLSRTMPVYYQYADGNKQIATDAIIQDISIDNIVEATISQGMLHVTAINPGTTTVILSSDSTPLTFSLQIHSSQDIVTRLELKTNKSIIASGEHLRLQAQIETNSSTPQDIPFNVVIPSGFASLPQAVHLLQSSGNIALQDVTNEHLQASLNKNRILAFTLSVSSGTAIATVSIDLMAAGHITAKQSKFTCSAMWPKDFQTQQNLLTKIMKSADAIVHIMPDPDFSTGTIVGKVFADFNANGKQDQNNQEYGLPHVFIALASGKWAITDKYGLYHIPNIEPGRDHIKLDANTLPAGSIHNQEDKRSITVHKGEFQRINFPISFGKHTPLSIDINPDYAHIVFDNQGQAQIPYNLQIPVNPAEVSLSIDGQSHTIKKSQSETQYSFHLPTNPQQVIITVHLPDGWLYLFHLPTLQTSTQQSGWLVTQAPLLLGSLFLPPHPYSIPAENFSLLGHIAQDGSSLNVAISSPHGEAKQSCNTTDKKFFHCPIQLHTDKNGTSYVKIQTSFSRKIIQSQKSEHVSWSKNIPVDTNKHFLIAAGSIAIENISSAEDIAVTGHTRFIYRGKIKGQYLIEAGFKSELQQFLELSSYLEPNKEQIALSLDPNSYYPVYGDTSKHGDYFSSSENLFVRLSAPYASLHLGRLITGKQTSSLLRYQRMLFGLQGRYQLFKDSPWGTTITAFLAKPESIHATDVFYGTGGSLYYLSHNNLIVGSYHVRLEILEPHSQLPSTVVMLQELRDYSLDPLSGRLLFNQPLVHYLPAEDFLSSGYIIRIHAEYEYLPQSNSDLAVGLTLHQKLHGMATVMGKYISELSKPQTGGDYAAHYSLWGAGVQFKPSELLSVKYKYAHSQGRSNNIHQVSEDGGLHFIQKDMSLGAQMGDAHSLNITSIIGKQKIYGYARIYDRGYTDTRQAPGAQKRQIGLKLQLEPYKNGSMNVWYNHLQLQSNPLNPHNIYNNASLRFDHRFGKITLGTDAAWQEQLLVDSFQASAAIGLHGIYSFSNQSTLHIRAAGKVLDKQLNTEAITTMPKNELALGGLYAFNQNNKAGGEISVHDQGIGSKIQLSIKPWKNTNLYWNYQYNQLNPYLIEPQKHTFTMGSKQFFNSGAVAFVEENTHQNIEQTWSGTRTVGLSVPVQKWNLGADYSRQSVSTNLINNSAFIQAAYANSKIQILNRVEGRVTQQDQQDNTYQYMVLSRLDWNVSQDLTLASSFKGSQTWLENEAPTHEFAEAHTGFAFRPKQWDLINIFARYTLSYEHQKLDTESFSNSLSHIVSFTTLVKTHSLFDVVPKISWRHTRLSVTQSGTLESDYLLSALRGDFHLPWKWDASVEGRICHDFQTDSPAMGSLIELSYTILKYMRLGVGYNFSSISAGSVDCRSTDAQGLFIRAEALY